LLSLWCGTLSKALLKSSSAISICFHKATGPDKIQVRFIKEMALEKTPAITYLFNKSLELGRVPNDWLDAHIVPVFKKGDTNTPSKP
jgi:hypothetical protein